MLPVIGAAINEGAKALAATKTDNAEMKNRFMP